MPAAPSESVTERADRLRRNVGLILAPSVFLLLLVVPLDLPPEAHRLAAVFGLVIVLWVTEAIPLAATAAEIAICRRIIDEVAADVFTTSGREVSYMVGTMIELPRAAVCADQLAAEAEFFSFGTNDLTQTALGISRDDAANFMHAYQEAEIYETDPFVSIDVDGVGQLVQIGADKGRSVRGDIKLGICGEHGGDPKSVAFCETVELDYVSCSPFRVPIARLAAAQATLTDN